MLVRHGRSGQKDGRPRGFRSRGRVFVRKLLIPMALTATVLLLSACKPFIDERSFTKKAPEEAEQPSAVETVRTSSRSKGSSRARSPWGCGSTGRTASAAARWRCLCRWLGRLLSGAAGGRQDADEPRHPGLLLWHAGRRSGSAVGPDHGRLQNALRAAAGGAVSAAFGSRRATRIRPSKAAPASQPGG